MASLPKKQFGLILKKENRALKTTKIATLFAEDETEKVDTQVMSSENASASTMRIRMQAKREHERALAEDPSVFEYDEIYEDLQIARDSKQADQKAADKERKPKYIEQFLKTHKRRELEQQLRDERKQEKERQAEGDMYKDKDVFVTRAYRKQMEEAQELRKELALQDRIDDLTAVEKQKLWQAGFQRTVLKNIARDEQPIPSTSKAASEIKMEEAEKAESASAIAEHAEKLKYLRKQVIACEDDVLPSISKAKVKSEPRDEVDGSKIEKSIYSDDSGEESPTEETKVELKPGLNLLSRPKKLTKAEQLRNRFTPSDSDSNEDLDKSQSTRSRKRSSTPDDRCRYKSRTNSRRGGISRSRERKVRKDSGTHDYRDRDRRRCPKERSPEKGRKHSRNTRGDYRHKHRHDSSDSDSNRPDEKNRKQRNRPLDRGTKKAQASVKKSSGDKTMTKEQRLKGLKQILKQRNGEKEVAEFRKRYLQRKESGFVTLPL